MRLPLHIAPMEGMTTFPMRVFLNMTSQPDGATSPFIRVTKNFPDRELPETFIPENTVLQGRYPYSIVPQFMACDADNFLRACTLLPPEAAPFVELNCGCPTPNAAGRNAGSGILERPDVFRATLSHLISHLGPGRLAVKMRVGFADAAEFPDLLAAVSDLPLARLAVHGRTRKERYSGTSRWELIQQAAAASRSQTFGSGDIFSVRKMRSSAGTAPGTKGVFIGRGLLHNPWLIDELRIGEKVSMTAKTLIHALVCAGILHDLCLSRPTKLIRLIGEGKVAPYCGGDAAKWEEASLALINAAGLPPTVISREAPVPDVTLSPVAYAKIRVLWNYMRPFLPECLQEAKLARVKSMRELAEGIWMRTSSEAELCFDAPQQQG
jgi:tRNA-dihydrouridine synthase